MQTLHKFFASFTQLPDTVKNNFSIFDVDSSEIAINKKKLKHYDLENMVLERGSKVLNVFLVAHTHLDPGWLNTVDEYYQ